MYYIVVAFYLIAGPLLGVGIGLISYYGLIILGDNLSEQARDYLMSFWALAGFVCGISEAYKATRIQIQITNDTDKGKRRTLMLLFSKCFSIVDYFWSVRSPYRNMGIKMLKRRNRWLSFTSAILMFAGLLLPLLFTDAVPDDGKVWYVLFTLSSMITLPAAFVLLVTMPFGIQRFYEFASYQEISDGIGWRGLYSLYSLAIVFWLVSSFKVLPWIVKYYW
jgi:hypothetical protein